MFTPGKGDGNAMQNIPVPTLTDIDNMSRERCEHERMRLRNEISFARSGAMWGGPSVKELIELLQLALARVEQRLKAIAINSESHYTA